MKKVYFDNLKHKIQLKHFKYKHEMQCYCISTTKCKARQYVFQMHVFEIGLLHSVARMVGDPKFYYPRRARSASAWILFSLWMYVCMFVCMLPL